MLSQSLVLTTENAFISLFKSLFFSAYGKYKGIYLKERVKPNKQSRNVENILSDQHHEMYPLNPIFYIVELGFTGEYIIFLISFN